MRVSKACLLYGLTAPQSLRAPSFGGFEGIFSEDSLLSRSLEIVEHAETTVQIYMGHFRTSYYLTAYHQHNASSGLASLIFRFRASLSSDLNQHDRLWAHGDSQLQRRQDSI